MGDSVEKVFVQALSTAKKIRKTGGTQPLPSERLRLYGLYKQAMEGDVDGVMERPGDGFGLAVDELHWEQDKWDSWNSQRGLSRTDAKRRYVEALVDTMHKHATTRHAMDLVTELEFAWNQMENNSPGSSGSSQTPPRPGADVEAAGRRFQQPLSGADGPLKVLSPMSEEDEAEQDYQRRIAESEGGDDGGYVKRGDKWSKQMERAIVRLSDQIAALREQISSGREWRSRREKSIRAWFGWTFWVISKHLVIDAAVLGLVLLWMRRTKDRRLEDHVRGALAVLREYARKILPPR